MNNEGTRTKEAFNAFTKAVETIPGGSNIAKAVHIMWADETSYDEVAALTLDQFKELLDNPEFTDEQASALLEQFKIYMAKKEGRTMGGKHKARRTRKQKKRSKKTRKH